MFKRLLCLLLVYTPALANKQQSEEALKNVDAVVFEVRDPKKRGGGTGFAMEAVSGKTYVITNSHVCEAIIKMTNGNIVLLVHDGKEFTRKILKMSDVSDLCLIEGVEGFRGLKLASSIEVGETIYTVGHPLLQKRTTTQGKVTKFTNIETLHHVIKSGNIGTDTILNASSESCDKPKLRVEEFDVKYFPLVSVIKAKVCVLTENKAMITSATIRPGSSGSPVVNKRGKVVGVMFAVNSASSYGSAVNIIQLYKFLQNF